MTIWIAVGDETSNWDKLSSQKVGTAIVLGTLDNWRNALAERPVKNSERSIEHRMAQTLQNLPEQATKSSVHHVRDALKVWQNQSAPPPKDPLRIEVETHLNWLATHSSLITLGLWDKGSTMQKILPSGNDRAVLLGQTYGLLAALALPFIQKSDCVLVALGTRSEPTGNLAEARSGAQNKHHSSQKPYGKQSRGPTGNRSMVSSASAKLQKLQQQWPHTALATCEFATLNYFAEHPKGQLSFIQQKQKKAMQAIADLAATILLFQGIQPKFKPISVKSAHSCPNVALYQLSTLFLDYTP